MCPYSLDREELIISQLWSFQGARELPPAEREIAGPRVLLQAALWPGLSKLSSTRYVELDVFLGELDAGRIHHGRAAHRS